MIDLIIQNGTLVIPECGLVESAVAIDRGKIVGIGDSTCLPRAARIIDARGKYVIPGVIDPHVHLGTNPEQFSSLAVTESRAAVIGGVTTVGCYLRDKGSYLSSYSDYMDTIRNGVYTNMCFHVQISTEEHLSELKEYAEKIGSNTFKFYMCGNAGIVESASDGFIYAGFKKVASLGPNALATVHAENESVIDRCIEEAKAQKEDGGLVDWYLTRPSFAEAEAVVRAAQLAKAANVRLYCVHMTSEAAMRCLKELKKKNRNLYAEATSAHLGLDAADPIGLMAKMIPPIRSKEDKEALWQGVREDIVDTFGTDNVTRSLADKQLEKGLWGSKTGYAVLGTHLPVLLDEGYHKHGLPLKQIIRKATMAPAKIFGMYPRKGTIQVGSDADLVIIDLDMVKKVDPALIGSCSDFSIFQGKELKGWPIMTIVNGEVIAEDGHLVHTKGNGRFIPRHA
ncbi:dihydroorotase [Anaerotruncus colihominis]|uniref:dihydroorotase n=1 Tax=Anaerotruncus colihominis TaxID=169435 RepID=UPI003996AC84